MSIPWTICFLSPTLIWLIRGENYKYGEQPKGSSVFSVAVTQFGDSTVVLTSSSESSSTSHLFNTPE
jgi:hypothetical protein